MSRGVDFNDVLLEEGEAAIRAALADAELPGQRPFPPIEAYEDTAEVGKDLPPLPGGAGPEEWAGTSAPDRQFIVPHWIVRRSAGLLGGQDGVGKSLLGQQLATSAAAAVPFLGLPVDRVKAIYSTCEDPLEELQRRQEAINSAQGLTMEQLRGWLRVHSLKGQLGNELATFDERRRLAPTDRYRQLRATALDFGAQLILVDNAAHVFAGNENDRHEVAAFLGLLERLSEEIDGAVIILAHPNKQHGQGHKQGNEYSGTTGWSAHVRNRLFFDWASDDPTADADERVLRRSKANYAARGEEVRCRWFKGAFVRDEDLPPNLVEEIARTAAANADNDIFLTCLRERTRQTRAVSEKHSPTFAPSEFAKMSEGKGLSKARLEAAMNRLFRLGAIERAELWKGPDRKPVYGLRETAGNGAGNGAGDVRETLSAAEAVNGPGDAGETYTVSKDTYGAALGAAAPDPEVPF